MDQTDVPTQPVAQRKVTAYGALTDEKDEYPSQKTPPFAEEGTPQKPYYVEEPREAPNISFFKNPFTIHWGWGLIGFIVGSGYLALLSDVKATYMLLGGLGAGMLLSVTPKVSIAVLVLAIGYHILFV